MFACVRKALKCVWMKNLLDVRLSELFHYVVLLQMILTTVTRIRVAWFIRNPSFERAGLFTPVVSKKWTFSTLQKRLVPSFILQKY